MKFKVIARNSISIVGVVGPFDSFKQAHTEAQNLADKVGHQKDVEVLLLDEKGMKEHGVDSAVESIEAFNQEKFSGPIPNPFRLSKTDKLIVDDFTNRIEEWGLHLKSDGKELHGMWMGGRGIAFWDGDKVYFRDLGSKAAETVQRYLKKRLPKNDFGGFKQTASWQKSSWRRNSKKYSPQYKIGETLFRGSPVFVERLTVADIKKRSPKGRGQQHAREMSDVHRAAASKAKPDSLHFFHMKMAAAFSSLASIYQDMEAQSRFKRQHGKSRDSAYPSASATQKYHRSALSKDLESARSALDEFRQDTAQPLSSQYTGKVTSDDVSKAGQRWRRNPGHDWIGEVDQEIEDDGTEGAFTRQARRAGYKNTMEFARKVMKGWRSGKKTVFNKKTKKQQGITKQTMSRANFAINAQKRRRNPDNMPTLYIIVDDDTKEWAGGQIFRSATKAVEYAEEMTRRTRECGPPTKRYSAEIGNDHPVMGPKLRLSQERRRESLTGRCKVDPKVANRVSTGWNAPRKIHSDYVGHRVGLADGLHVLGTETRIDDRGKGPKREGNL